MIVNLFLLPIVCMLAVTVLIVRLTGPLKVATAFCGGVLLAMLIGTVVLVPMAGSSADVTPPAPVGAPAGDSQVAWWQACTAAALDAQRTGDLSSLATACPVVEVDTY